MCLIPHERDLSVQLLAKYIFSRKHKVDLVILTGDFNACEGEASMNYLFGQDGSPIAMQDTYRALHPKSKVTTFHAFGKSINECKIDYIYTLGKVNVIEADIITDPEGAGFASDHYPVTANIRVGK
jgi:endonuclease/exonuclease/phosphatase family metal-dependent hydrolase